LPKNHFKSNKVLTKDIVMRQPTDGVSQGSILGYCWIGALQFAMFISRMSNIPTAHDHIHLEHCCQIWVLQFITTEILN